MYVLLGSNGQITSQIARLLLTMGHRVRVVGRQADTLAPLAKAGAEVAAGDVADAVFLERAFTGASAAYTMIPPCYAEHDMHAAQDRIGAAIARALSKVPVPRVVNLSSMGAELPHGTGPIEALHAQERRLSAIGGIDLLHLRPGSFMQNLLHAAAGVLPGLEAADATIPMVCTKDIAAVAARELATPQHRGVLLLHAPRHISMREAAAVLGAAIGKAGLAYVQSAPAEGKAELRAHGFSASAADQIEVLARWLSTSPLASASMAPVEVQATTIERFAHEQFEPAYARLALGVA